MNLTSAILPKFSVAPMRHVVLENMGGVVSIVIVSCVRSSGGRSLRVLNITGGRWVAVSLHILSREEYTRTSLDFSLKSPRN